MVGKISMTQKSYVPPSFGKTAFHCPYCNVYAHQIWGDIFTNVGRTYDQKDVENTKISACIRCGSYCFWVNEKLIYPAQVVAPAAHQKMPPSVSEYYDEAREVSAVSARAAAALLRIAIKKLCEELGEKDPNLNTAIGNLNEKGLPNAVIKSLDTVRIVGNEGGAHEGEIDLTGKDNSKITNKLFHLINIIVEKTIAEPEQIEEIFSTLPENKKQGVSDRDNK